LRSGWASRLRAGATRLPVPSKPKLMIFRCERLALPGVDARCRSGIPSARRERSSGRPQDRREQLWNTFCSSCLACSWASIWASWPSLCAGHPARRRYRAPHRLTRPNRVWHRANRCPWSPEAALDQLVVFLILNVGCLLGFLLVPLLGDRGVFLVFLACSLLLAAWVWHAPS